MEINEKEFISSDGEKIFYYQFLPENGDVKFVFQISHGMAEHSARYKDFAKFIVSKGGAVYAADHRGHGKNINKKDDYGFWPTKNTWYKVVDDIKILNSIIKNNYPQKPHFILGHNIGSFIVRGYIINHSHETDGIIISGTGTYSKLFLQKIKYIIKINILFKGTAHRSSFIFKSAFGKITKEYKKPYEWLTHDENVVNAYNDDPYNGGIMTNSFYRGLCNGIIQINKLKNVKSVRKDLPVIFIAGTGDPVGYKTRGVDKAVELFEKAGLSEVELKLYDGGRHEMLQEINKEEVYNDIYNWMSHYMN